MATLCLLFLLFLSLTPNFCQQAHTHACGTRQVCSSSRTQWKIMGVWAFISVCWLPRLTSCKFTLATGAHNGSSVLFTIPASGGHLYAPSSRRQKQRDMLVAQIRCKMSQVKRQLMSQVTHALVSDLYQKCNWHLFHMNTACCFSHNTYLLTFSVCFHSFYWTVMIFKLQSDSKHIKQSKKDGLKLWGFCQLEQEELRKLFFS